MESPSRTLTRPSLSSNSPEFEFWNNPPGPISSPLHSADELFSDGFLLPLYSLPKPRPEPEYDHEPGSGDVLETEPGLSVNSAHITSDVSSNGSLILNASKRWKEIIFKRSNNNDSEEIKHGKTDKKREKERKNKSGSSSAELNINLWPFSRSRSAGNNTTRSNKPVSSNRKVSSAPCSRSNSSGESKSSRRSWPGSPARGGVHVGRASPVWQVKKAGPVNRASPGGGPGKGKVSSVPVCIGYRHQHLDCRSYENGAVVGGGESGGGGVKNGGGNGGVKSGGGNLFGFRGLFSKKNTTVLTV